jgi:FtsP/CotA-like multicopper oxidase with cupredoxin domain
MVGKRTRRSACVVVVAAMVLVLGSCSSESSSPPPGTDGSAPPATTTGGAPYREPVKLSPTDGVLEVRLSAHQSDVVLDTVASPVSNFLVYGYELVRGAASDGTTTGDGLYPAPTLQVDPGEKLIVHYDNDLQGLTISDYYDPAFTPAGGTVPLYPPALTEAPLNLHTHGLHVSPDGNADNVLLDIPAGMGNRYEYDVPDEMPNGLYWYHGHLHTMTAAQTYMGLAGLLEIGRSDGNLPIVTENELPIRNMALQYNFVFDRAGDGRALNNPNWPQYVSTLDPPAGDELAAGTYEPSLAPTNFAESAEGTQYLTNWYSGPLSPDNHRGQTQFIPSNLQTFTPLAAAGPAGSTPGTAGAASELVPTTVPANPSLPDAERDVQYTVNGQFQPDLSSKPGQTEIWVLANISDFAYLRLTLTETATGNHPPFRLVGQDGNPFPEVHAPVDGDGTTLVIPPASRYAVAVTMPETGELVLEMPPEPGAQAVTNQGVLYTNDGTDSPPAQLGTLTIDPSHISYADGFFVFPTQELIRVKPDTSGTGTTVPFEVGQPLDAYTSFVDTSVMAPDVTRNLQVSGGFSNTNASTNDPKAFTYEFDDNTFPYIPLIQPRLDSVEEWIITNFNNDEHPMHIHVNDFQVTEIVDPVAGTTTGVQMWGQDNVNVPAPVTDDQENPLTPAQVTLRTEFTDYTGTYVIHCHRLNHEDNGLMAIINVIPAVSTYAVAVPGTAGTDATVQVYDGEGDRLVETVTPFPGYEGTPSVTMGDVDGDQVLDLVVATGPGVAPEVVAYSGSYAGDVTPFENELARFAPFDDEGTGGISVAVAGIDGTGLAGNIVVGSAAGTDSEVKVFATDLQRVMNTGEAPEVFSTFVPYQGSKAGVSVATGMVDASSGRASIVTAPGPGEPAEIKTFRYDLYTPTARSSAGSSGSGSGTTPGTHAGHDEGSGDPQQTSAFLAFDESYVGGVSLATGWVAGAEGGAKSIVTSMLAGPGTVKVWSSGSRLDGAPLMYLESPNHHGGDVAFREIASFEPFSTAGSRGVHVATTATTTGANLIVSGPSADGTSTEVRTYALARPDATATTVTPSLLSDVVSLRGSPTAPLGGQ